MRLEAFSFRAMGSPCQIHFWGPSRSALMPIMRLCAQEIRRLEHKFSRYRDDSLTTQINRSAGDPQGLELDAETAALLDFAATAHAESEGRFDPTSGVLRRVWDFKSGQLPDPDALKMTRALVGWDKVVWDSPRFVLPLAGMEIDFGGFVKEYAADRVAELCRENGITSGLVDLGGDLACIGPHPNLEPWLIGIRNPRDPDSAIARIALSSGGLATSGDYERCMVIDGTRYPHIMDPRTGESYREGPACVSVTAPHCLVAGITSTIAMVHAERQALDFLGDIGLAHLVIDQSGKISGSVELHEPVRKILRSESQPSPARSDATLAASIIEANAVT